MAREKTEKSPTVRYLEQLVLGDDPKAIAEYEKGLVDLDVAQAVYDLRTGAKLTQRQLAAKVGTTASVICRLEDANYEGHSLAMLKRIAAAVGKRLEIRFVPINRPRRKRRPAA